jgi:hypothetical protein
MIFQKSISEKFMSKQIPEICLARLKLESKTFLLNILFWSGSCYIVTKLLQLIKIKIFISFFGSFKIPFWENSNDRSEYSTNQLRIKSEHSAETESTP